MIAARRPSCRAALLAALASAALTLAPGTPAHALVATPDVAAAEAAGPVSTAALGARCVGPAFDDTAAFQAAIDTGHTVYAPALGGQCHITHALVMRTPGQIFHGDGRARTKIVIDPGFTGEGVFVAKTGEPGPVWRDLSVSFAQPDTDDRAKLTRYPPAFSVPDTPRFEMEHLGCYVATTCVDMKGNSGGATIADLQMSAFEVGIDIDGSLDTVRINDLHWWPFGMIGRQQQLFSHSTSNPPTAVLIGRLDGLVLNRSFFLGGEAIHFFKSKRGPAFAMISDTGFDTCIGVVVEGGGIRMSNLDFASNSGTTTALDVIAGNVTVSSSHFFVGTSSHLPFIKLFEGNLIITGAQFEVGPNDVTMIEESGPGVLTLLANQFVRVPDLAYKMPTIDVKAGRIVAEGNYASDKGRGSGVFFEIAKTDLFNRFVGNSSPGWIR